MKKTFFSLVLFATLTFFFNESIAVCIGCGCNSTYNRCVANGSDDCPTQWIDLSTGQTITATEEGQKGCCGVAWRNCHEGFGVGTRWWGAIVVSQATEFPEGEVLEPNIKVAFSINGNVFGSNDGGQIIKTYNLLTQNELDQIVHLQPIINKILNGQLLTFSEMMAIN
ncbi:MAG: hypothetical protein KBB37_11820 [Bacteroidia bacterium]|jgi:hypothetical protein|nr:hypothetical protein [Bacteroidia bacterium]MBP9847372.1 hypothetical protein [Saprospiraceae bacterium]